MGRVTSVRTVQPRRSGALPPPHSGRRILLICLLDWGCNRQVPQQHGCDPNRFAEEGRDPAWDLLFIRTWANFGPVKFTISTRFRHLGGCALLAAG
jgi:hypothetical protein